MAVYVARVERAEWIGVYRQDPDHERRVAEVPVPAGASLRAVLLAAGWRPTGRRARGGWGSIFVTPAEDRPHPT